MSAVVLAEFKKKKEADLVVELIGQFRSGKILGRGKDLEELYFAELIKEGYKERGYVSSAVFKKHLARRTSKRAG